jgi:hypothetical protein
MVPRPELSYALDARYLTTAASPPGNLEEGTGFTDPELRIAAGADRFNMSLPS